MKVVTAPERYVQADWDESVFLAGGITGCRDWQSKIIRLLENNMQLTGINPVILNPRRENFPIYNKAAAFEQIQWEYEMLEKCDIFSMYFCAGESDQPICMYELGRNIVRMQTRYPSSWRDRIVISVEDGYRRKQDVLIQTKLATNNLVPVNTKEVCLTWHAFNIVNALSKIRKYKPMVQN